MKIRHCSGQTFRGDIINEDRWRIWVKTSTGRVFQIMKADIVRKDED